MHDSNDWARRLNPPRRNHFFYGKMMGIAQFEREQRYGMGQRWLMNRLSLGTGILCGLKADVVVLPDAGQRIRLEPGVAVDPLGREIVVAYRFDFDPFKAPGPCGCGGSPPPTEAGTYQLTISYHECAADQLPVPTPQDCEGVSDCDFDTTVETFLLSLRKVPDPTPSRFDCTWTKPVVVAEATEPLDPGAAAEPAATRPPTTEELKRRLAEMLRSMGTTVPTDTCVVLGTVEITGSPAAFTIASVSPDGRVYLYSQAELFEMILCLARCCGEHNETPTIPEDDETLRLMDVNFRWNPRRTEDLGDVDIPLDSLEKTTIDARGGTDIWDPLFLKFTFNKPLDGTTVSSILSNQLGIEITYTAPGAPAQKLTVESFLSDAHIVMFSVPGAPGTYEVVLSGTSANGTAIRSWHEHRDLDGEPARPLAGVPPGRPVPSGDNHDGGDFKFKFTLVQPNRTDTFRIIEIEFLGDGNTILQGEGATPIFRAGTLFGFRVRFNMSVDPKNVLAAADEAAQENATIRIWPFVPLAATVGPVGDEIEVRRPSSLILKPRAQQAFAPGEYVVTLIGGPVPTAPGKLVIRSTGSQILDGEPGMAPTPLPSGDRTEGGDFVFSFSVRRAP